MLAKLMNAINKTPPQNEEQLTVLRDNDKK